VDNDTSDTDRIGGMHDAPCGVSNHRAAEALALISAIDSEPRIGKPINSENWSETAEGVARESVSSCPRAGCGRSACPVREHNNRDWVGHIAPETTRSCSDVHGAGSQGKIGNDPVGLAYRECPRSAARLVGECPPFEPLIQGNNTGGKISGLMVGADGPRSG
jgi:hypothetical protein